MQTIFDKKKPKVLPWLISIIVIGGAAFYLYTTMKTNDEAPVTANNVQSPVTNQVTVESPDSANGIVFSQTDVKFNKTISPQKFDGMPMVVYFWDPSVPKQAARIVKMVALQKSYMKKMIVIGVACNNTNGIKDYVVESGMNFPVLLESAELIASFSPKQNESLCVLVSPDLKVAMRFDGFIDFDKLGQNIDAMLGYK